MSDLLDAMGIDPESAEWQELALCRGMTFKKVEEDPFFDGYATDEDIAIQTDEMCLTCPVTKQCGMHGIKERLHGVWGGVWLTNGKMDKNKNAHKTDEVWARLRERLSE